MAERASCGVIHVGGDPSPTQRASPRFELASADYYEDDGTHIIPRDREDEELTKSDWQSKIAWNNFHACTIGPSMSSLAPGIVASDGRAPFDLDRPAHEFIADPLPVDMATFFETNAFGIYLLGHDAVADHHIAMNRSADGSYAVDWSGRIALAYAGEHDFKYSFNARVTGVHFDSISMFYFDGSNAKEFLGVDLDANVSLRDRLAPYVVDPDQFVLEMRHGIPHAVRRR